MINSNFGVNQRTIHCDYVQSGFVSEIAIKWIIYDRNILSTGLRPVFLRVGYDKSKKKERYKENRVINNAEMSANLLENFAALPADVREKLAELDLELSEGLLTIFFPLH